MNFSRCFTHDTPTHSLGLYTPTHARTYAHAHLHSQTKCHKHTLSLWCPLNCLCGSAPAAEPLGSASSPRSPADSDLLPVEHFHENLLDVDGSNYGF